jgi:Uma2 family endonuclease
MSTAVLPSPTALAQTPPPRADGPKPWRITRDEYYRLGELGFFDGKRVELIRGEVIEMSPINIAHARGVGFVADALALVFAIGHYVNVQQPFALPGAAPGTEPQPDVAVIPGSRRTATAHPTQATLLVEVADSTLFYDSTTKAQLYAEAGVPEYWILDINARQLIVLRDPGPMPQGLAGIGYQTHLTFGSAERVSPLAAPQAAVLVGDLLP